MRAVLLAWFIGFAAVPARAGEALSISIHESAIVRDPLMRQIQRRLLREGSVPAYVAVRGEGARIVAVPLVDLSAGPASLLSPLAASVASEALAGLRPNPRLMQTEQAGATVKGKGRVKAAEKQLKAIHDKKSWLAPR